MSVACTNGEAYSIQHYVIKFVNDLLQFSDFLRVLWFTPPKNKINLHDISKNIVESGIKHHNP